VPAGIVSHIPSEGCQYSVNYDGTEKLLLGAHRLYEQGKHQLLAWLPRWLAIADGDGEVSWPSRIHISQGEADLAARHAAARAAGRAAAAGKK
jgi:hypothetical protein